MNDLAPLIRQLRAALLVTEREAAVRLVDAYSPVYRSLYQRLLHLLAQLQAADDGEQAFNAYAWAQQANRLDRLLASVQTSVTVFANEARRVVQSGIEPMLTAGQQDAIKLLEASLDNRITLLFGRPSERALDVLINRGASHIKVAELFEKLPTETVQAVRKRLIAGLVSGQNPRIVAADVSKGLGVPLNRALTISRTEMLNAYRSAALDTYNANSDVVEGWIWDAAAGCCAFCAGMDGTEHDLDEPMDSHPNCRCAPRPKTKSYDDILANIA